MSLGNQIRQVARQISLGQAGRQLQAQPLPVDTQQLPDALVKLRTVTQHPVTKADSNHRVIYRPIPAGFSGQPGEELLIALKQLFQGVKKQAFAKAPGAAQKVGTTFLDQLQGVRGFVHVIAVLLTQLGKALNTNRQFAPGQGRGGGHGQILGRP